MAKQSGKDASNLFAELAKNRQASSEPAAPPETPAPNTDAPPPAKGRAKGKRSDPNYIQVGARIPKDLKKEVERRLIDEPFDFSDLVADLLDKWLTDLPGDQSDG